MTVFSRESSAKIIISLVLGLIVLFAYLPSIKAPFILDDHHKIVNNPDIKADIPGRLIYPYTSARGINRNDPSRPLVYLTYTLNYRAGGMNTFGYHLINLLIHFLNVCLFFFLTIILFRGLKFENFRTAAFLAALLFAVHPVNAYTVSYIFCRSDLMSAFFILLSAVSFLKFRKSGGAVRYIFSLACFICALLSKQSAVVLPALLLLADTAAGNERNKTAVPAHLGFWLAVSLYLAARYSYFGTIGDAEANASWKISYYLLIQPYVFLKYIQLLAVPAGLSFFHHIMPTELISSKFLWPFLSLIAAGTLIFSVVRSRSAFAKPLLLASGWFVLALLPVSILPTTNSFAENRIYLPALGFYWLCAAFYAFLYKKLSLCLNGRFRIAVITAVCLHLLILFLITSQKNNLMARPLLLWNEVIENYPDSALAHNQKGIIFVEAGLNEKALDEFNTALQLNPENTGALRNRADLYFFRNDIPKALKDYEQLRKMMPEDKNIELRIADCREAAED